MTQINLTSAGGPARRLMLATAGLLALIILTGCNASPTPSIEEYQDTVLSTLQGDRLRDTGLDQIIDITVGDLGCTGELCSSPVRFQYLREEVNSRRPLIADYRGRLCKPEVTPPDSLQTDHQLLCGELEKLFKSLDAIVVNASSALSILNASGGADGDNQAILNEFSERLSREQEKLSQIRARLSEIEFLRRLFPNS